MSWTLIEPRGRRIARQVKTRLVLAPKPRLHDSLQWPCGMIKRIGRRWTRTAVWWCRAMHGRVTWPVYGQYRCRHCHRIYAVPWN